MKALVFTPFYAPVIGGLENYARQLNNALIAQEGWEIVVVTSRKGRRQAQGTIDGHPIYRLATWLTLSNTPINLFWPFAIRRIIQREKPDLIMAHSPVPSMADAAAITKGKVPFVLVYHAATLLKHGKPLFNLVARLYGLFGALTLRRADRIFAVSGFVRERLAVDLQAKTVVVPNAVWAHDIAGREQPSSVDFIFIASLAHSHAWKGLHQIIEAVALYSERYGDDIHLTVVGDGDMRGTYERLATHLGIQNHVRFAGAVVGEAKTRLIREAMAMIVYPTTENDAFPTVMLEAWAQCVPVIAARIGSLGTLVHDGMDGYLCEPQRPDVLAQRMHEVVLSSVASRTKVAHAAMERTEHNYTWEKQAKLVHEAVKELL